MLVEKYWPRSLGIFVMTRRKLRYQYKTRLGYNSNETYGLFLYNKQTGQYICFAERVFVKKESREA